MVGHTHEDIVGNIGYLSKKLKEQNDTSPSSLMDSTTSLKVKTSEGEGIGVHSLARNTSGVEGHVVVPGWDLEN
jgi:hypothetical protein